MRMMLKSKIHRATVTDADINYEGSITIDSRLMKEADILPYEQVHVLNIDNGARFTTYAIEGGEGSGEICVNGAAARLVVKGDTVIILTYTDVPGDQLRHYKPIIILVNEKNEIVSKIGEKIFA
jgi:aspartate 1-decarboxylase